MVGWFCCFFSDQREIQELLSLGVCRIPAWSRCSWTTLPLLFSVHPLVWVSFLPEVPPEVERSCPFCSEQFLSLDPPSSSSIPWEPGPPPGRQLHAGPLLQLAELRYDLLGFCVN